jgi:hypothetical protein
VRRVAEGREYRIDGMPEVVHLAQLTPQEPHVASRGAEHEAFHLLFSLPYSREQVASYTFPAPLPERAVATSPPRWRGVAGWSALGLAGASVGGGVALTLVGRSVRAGDSVNEPHAAAFERNQRIQRLNQGATLLYTAGAVAGAAGLGLLLYPSLTPEGGALFLDGRF